MPHSQHPLLASLNQAQQIHKRGCQLAKLLFVPQVDQERSCGDDVLDSHLVVGGFLLFGDHDSVMRAKQSNQFDGRERCAEHLQLFPGVFIPLLGPPAGFFLSQFRPVVPQADVIAIPREALNRPRRVQRRSDLLLAMDKEWSQRF